MTNGRLDPRTLRCARISGSKNDFAFFSIDLEDLLISPTSPSSSRTR